MRTMLSVILVAALVCAAMAEDKPAMSAQDEAMMKACMELAAPGPQHQAMAKDVGKWNGQMKFWMDPTAPAQETACMRTAYMDMDGRYLIEEETSNMMGMPYKGKSTVGFDKFRGEYVFFYYDNMSTAFMTARGKLADDGKSIEYKGTSDDPMTNRKDVPLRMVMREADADHQSMEMYTTSPDGKEFKCMEIAYTRVKEEAGK